MNIIQTPLKDCLIIEPRVFKDERGYFFESFNAEKFKDATGVTLAFVQDNESYSTAKVLRGLHYQIEHPQGKLVRVTEGAVWDVAVDLRKSSPSFGRWTGVELSAENQRQFWVPPGFAHGFVVLSESAKFLYKTTDYWFAAHERCLLWSDPMLNIDWKVDGPKVNVKDAAGVCFKDADTFA